MLILQFVNFSYLVFSRILVSSTYICSYQVNRNVYSDQIPTIHKDITTSTTKTLLLLQYQYSFLGIQNYQAVYDAPFVSKLLERLGVIFCSFPLNFVRFRHIAILQSLHNFGLRRKTMFPRFGFVCEGSIYNGLV